MSQRPRSPVRPVAVAALFAVAVLFAVGCGDSSAPSPFVSTDASTDVRPRDVTDAGALMDAPLDGSTGRAGEWGGPCIDDRSCDDAVSCTKDSCDGVSKRCHFVPDDSVCDDGAYCNGPEECVPAVGCRPGEPVACSDNTPCTIDACDEETDQCTRSPRDADADGDPDGNCPGGGDCNDTNPAVSSLIPEICGNGIDDNCNGTADESACSSPQYDTCAAPLDIDAPGSFVLTTEAAKLDYAASCVMTNSRSRDLAVALHVPSGDPVDVNLVLKATSGSTIGLAAAAQCGDASSEIACGAGATGSDRAPVARMRLRGLATGVYPVYVFSDSSDAITLTVDYVNPVPEPANETCGTSIPLEPGVHTEADLVDATQDLTTACGQPFGDLVFDFVLAEARDVRVFATANDSNGTPSLSLRSSNCVDQGSELLCHQDANDAIYYRALPTGHYYLDVGATGPADLDVLLETTPPTTAPADERCTGAPAIDWGSTTAVDMSDHMDDIHVGCGAGMPDAALALNVEAASDVLLVLGITNGDTGAVSLDAAACDDSAMLSCGTGGATPVRTVARGVAPGDYRIVVESKKSNPLSVTAFRRPAMPPFLVPFADDCAEAAEIPETGGSFQGNTSNASNDFTASCDVGGGPSSPDQLLHLRLSKQRRLIFDTRGSDYATIVDVRSGTTCPGDEVFGACSAGYSSGRSFVDVTLPAGEYWVQVDGYDSSSGPWVLDVFSTE